MSFFVEEKWVRRTEFMPVTLTRCIHLKSYAMQIYKLDLHLSREKVNTVANTDLRSEKDVILIATNHHRSENLESTPI